MFPLTYFNPLLILLTVMASCIQLLLSLGPSLSLSLSLRLTNANKGVYDKSNYSPEPDFWKNRLFRERYR